MVSSTKKISASTLKWRISILWALLLALTVTSTAYYQWHLNHLLAEREVSQTNLRTDAALATSLADLSKWAHAFGYGNESVKNLSNRVDPQWANEHIGPSRLKSCGISASLVFDAKNQFQIHFLANRQVWPRSLLVNLHHSIQPLLNQVREEAFQPAKPANGLIHIDQTTYLVAGQAIIADNIPPSTLPKNSTLVLLKSLDQDTLDQMSHRYLLQKLSLSHDKPESPRTGRALKSITDTTLGFLQWQPDKAEESISHALGYKIFLILLFLSLLALFFMRYGYRRCCKRSSRDPQIDQQIAHLEENEGTLRALMEAIPSPIFFKNTEGLYLGCNQAFSDYMGLPADAIIGHSVHDVAPADLAEIYHQADLDLMRKEGTQTYETPVRYADGSRHDTLVNKGIITNSNEQVIGLAGVITDISKIRKLQRKSDQLRQRLRSIIDSIPSLLITLDGEQYITAWNRRAAVTSRVSATRAIGRPLFEIFPTLKNYRTDLDSALASDKHQTYKRILWEQNERKVFIDVTVSPLAKGGGAVLRADIATDRVRMEEVMVLSEKMLSIGSLAAGMAHEINNPLAIILQHTQVLQNRLKPGMPKNLETAKNCNINLNHLADYLQQREIDTMFEAIRQAGNRAKIIIEEMVNFSRQHTTQHAPCDIPKLLEETLHLAKSDYDLKKKYGFQDIEIGMEIAQDTPLLVCNQQEIQQVLLNLLRNSAKALSLASIKNSRIKLSLKFNEQGIQLTTTDNGPGIVPNIMKRIFDPFFTTSKPGEGTGLGLSTAYFIICEKHRGRIRAENLPEGGCRFVINLPFKA